MAEFCTKCGKRLLTTDRGNITLSVPAGFEHKDCGLAGGESKSQPIPEPKPVVKEPKTPTRKHLIVYHELENEENNGDSEEN